MPGFLRGSSVSRSFSPASGWGLSYYWGEHPDKDRLVIVFDRDIPAYGLVRTDRTRLTMTVPAAAWRLEKKPGPGGFGAAKFIRSLALTPNGLTIDLRSPAIGYVHFTIPETRKLVVDVFGDPIGARWRPSGRPAPAPAATPAQAPQAPAPAPQTAQHAPLPAPRRCGRLCPDNPQAAADCGHPGPASRDNPAQWPGPGGTQDRGRMAGQATRARWRRQCRAGPSRAAAHSSPAPAACGDRRNACRARFCRPNAFPGRSPSLLCRALHLPLPHQYRRPGGMDAARPGRAHPGATRARRHAALSRSRRKRCRSPRPRLGSGP